MRYAVIALAACGSSAAPKPPPDARLDPMATLRSIAPIDVRCPDTGVFALFDGCAPLRHAVVRTFMGTTWLAIGADRPPSCEQLQPWVDRSQTILGVSLPSGPGGRYFDGKPFGTAIQLEHVDGRSVLVQMHHVLAVVEPPVSMTPGAHVRGAVQIAGHGAGPFDAIVCPDQGKVTDAQPDVTPPATPLDGTVFGEPFHGTASRAFVTPVDGGTYVLLGALDPDRGDPGCDRGIDRWFIDGLYVNGGGAAAPYPIHGAPQPAEVSHASLDGGQAYASGWIIWDDVPTTPGSTVRARLVAHSAPDVPERKRIDVEGAITATVCPPRR